VAEEGDRGPAKLAFAGLSVKSMVFQSLKDHAHVNQVLFLRLGENKDVVHVNLNKFPQHRAVPALSRRPPTAGIVERERGPPKNCMHGTHQEGGHAVKPKCANAELILAARDPEGSLELVLFSDPELMVGAGQVELGEKA
jgi:hypothetical protein